MLTSSASNVTLKDDQVDSVKQLQSTVQVCLTMHTGNLWVVTAGVFTLVSMAHTSHNTCSVHSSLHTTNAPISRNGCILYSLAPAGNGWICGWSTTRRCSWLHQQHTTTGAGQRKGKIQVNNNCLNNNTYVVV